MRCRKCGNENSGSFCIRCGALFSVKGQAPKPNETSEFLFAYEILSRIRGSRVGDESATFAYFDSDYASSKVKSLSENGYITTVRGYTTLDGYTVEQLKDILKFFGHIEVGTKNELISKIEDYVKEPELIKYFNCSVYVRTEKGEALFSDLAKYREQVKTGVFCYMVNAILNEDFKAAFTCFLYYEDNRYFGNTTFTVGDVYIYRWRYMSERCGKTAGACYIAASILSVSAKSYYDRYCSSNKITPDYNSLDRAGYYYSSACTEKEMQVYESAGVKNFKVVIGDDADCHICKKHNGKVRRVKGAKVNKSFPPFHVGCTCSVIVYED